MVEGGQQSGLPFKPCRALRIAGKRIRQELHGYAPSELGVAGPIALAHAAGPSQRNNFIGPDLGTRGKRHFSPLQWNSAAIITAALPNVSCPNVFCPNMFRSGDPKTI